MRIQFSKKDDLRFIGHLDFLRVFQQTIRRAALPAAYSQGFNPHILLSFALPLPLGMESENDYADLVLEEKPTDIRERLNVCAPPGLYIKSVYPTENNAASVVTEADYAFYPNGKDFDIEKLLNTEAIFISKKTKSGIKDVDIRPDIIDLKTADNFIIMRLSAGSSRFLHPLTAAELLTDEKPSPAAIRRLELFQPDEKGGSIPL